MLTSKSQTVAYREAYTISRLLGFEIDVTESSHTPTIRNTKSVIGASAFSI